MTTRKATRPAPSVEIVTVTPELATDWLGRNLHNRNVRQPKVAALAADMVDGAYLLTGDAIRYDWHGNFLDGQHRLMAVIESGVPIETFVIRGLDPRVRDVLDTGTRRSLSDVLRIRGETHATGLASALPVAVQWDKGGDAALRNAETGTQRPSHSACLAWLEENPRLRDEVRAVDGLRHPPLSLSPRFAAPFAYRARDLDSDQLDEFLRKMETGANLSESDPILHLRHWFMRAFSEQLQPTVHQRMAMLIKGFNYWRAGVPVERSLTFRTNEKFPVLGDTETRQARYDRQQRRSASVS